MIRFFHLKSFSQSLFATAKALLASILLSCAGQNALAAELYLNGTVLCGPRLAQSCEAFVVERGKLRAVGSNAEIRAQHRFGDRLIDLEGKTVIPGFVDGHSHFPGEGLSEVGVNVNSPPLGPVRELQDAFAAMRERLTSLAPGTWLYAYGLDDTLVREARLPSMNELDALSSTHPIFVQHISGHVGVANRRALEIMGYTDSTPDPVGGHFGRTAEGRLNGKLYESASDPIKQTALKRPLPELLAVIQAANGAYLSQGVTTAQSGATPDSLLSALAWMSKLGLVTPRLVVYPKDELGVEMLEGKNVAGHASERLHLGAVKFFVDGSIQNYGAWIQAPYYVPQNPFEPAGQGHARMDRERLQQEVSRFHQAGFQLALHANGDAAIDAVIRAVAQAQNEFPRPDARHIVIHAQMSSPEQLREMKRVGLTPSFFNSHIYYWGDRHRRLFLGPERAARLNPLRSALDSGLRISLHSDSPIVPLDPMFMLWSAGERLTRSGMRLGPQERITRLEGLRALTIDAAWQNFLEGDRGSLEAGKLADFVVLSENPLEVKDPRQVKVLATYIGGERVYQRP